MDKYYCYFLETEWHGTVTYAKSCEILTECSTEEEANAFCNEHKCMYVAASNIGEAERLIMQ